MVKQQSKNFWGDSPSGVSQASKSANETASDTPATKSKPKNRIAIDITWSSLLIIMVIIIAVTVTLNLQHTDNTGSKVEGTITTDNGDLKINWDRYPTYDVDLSEIYTITQSGTYHLTGSLTNQPITINADTNKVRLILDNVTINNNTGPAIICTAADNLVIELVGENNLSDGSKYGADYDEDVTGAIYSKSDLTFQGDGTLNLSANYQDGIVAKDDLKFNSGTYNITANDDAIRGKDSVYIVDGSFTLQSNADAIKSTNETDAGKGFVLIENGTFDISSAGKGIKAINSVLIYNGNFTINSTDDAIHSNNYIGLVGGTFVITSSDDGIHADRELIIDGGNVDIMKSYEGLEAQAITVNGGEISVIASDDGINAGGGADGSATNRQGAGAFDADTDCVVALNGGTIKINTSGDGIDSNGYIYFNGSTVTVDGPTNNGNGALDAGAGIVQSGGTVIAAGSSGMAMTLGQNSSVYSASIYFSAAQPAGTHIEIKDSTGKIIISYTSVKSFSHMAVGTTDFKAGETYTIYIDDKEYTTFTITDTVTTVGNNNTNQYNMPSMGGTSQMQRR